jgi:hypothetical protein
MTTEHVRRGLLHIVMILACLLAGGHLRAAAAEPTPPAVDPATMQAKVMCGYQGWFRCPGDASNLGWGHWSVSRKRIAPETLTVDLWPDTSDFTPAERFAAPGFHYEDGSQACLFSSDSPTIVLRHLQWMRDYGIDGPWLQRFLVGLPGGRFGKMYYTSNRRVMDHVIAAAQTTGRTWAISYDIAATQNKDIYEVLTNDWKRMVDEGVATGPRYLHEGGRPVVQIWGFYYGSDSNLMTPEVANKLIDFFAAPGRYQAFLVGGGGWNWRRTADPQWQEFYRRFKAICPWNVGNYGIDKKGVKNASTGAWAADLAECQRRGVTWLPVIYPGFSWNNLMQVRHVEKVTTIPRRDGQFLWDQFYALAKLKVDCAYLAMFDEVDEGTAMFKLATDSRVDSYTIHRSKLPSDWYLRVVHEGIKMLHGQRPITAEIPITP